MCVLDCAPSALKMLHNSTEFMPYVIFIGAPGMEQLKQIYAERRATGGSQRNLTVCCVAFSVCLCCCSVPIDNINVVRFTLTIGLIEE